ncbi:hypothetical protein DVA67_001210 [Solirubrobacter sp. CPCC 204708]|uniref:Uncharacterized protein n=1 Tax=Solirubrobacter deserti TaxID=2282478 RepID=A0ABT4RDI8_9ACTN|nr:hypothetical protein [Solirubrobacter deserti]MBE2314578.1 hypothetical protein [Solirubrobacter deserti]MDA0136582.1 hypothetical protein [Solirubrobacter deserti]
MRRFLTIFAVTALLLVAAAPASAGTLSTQNSCKWSYDNTWRHLNVDLSGVASPNPVAPGSGVNLTQTSVHVRIPDYLIQYGHSLQILKAGANEIRAKAWLAVEGPGSPQNVMVHQLETVARFTITEDANGQFVSTTPVDVTIPIPDTVWTVGTAPLGFRQAGPGTLLGIPGGTGGAVLDALGSAFIRMELGALAMTADCYPATGEGEVQPPATAAGAFETAAVDPNAGKIAAPKANPAVTVRGSSLKASGRRVKVQLSCTAADCNGALTLKAGSKTLATKKTYAVKSGAKKTVTLTLSKAAQRSLKDKKSLKVTVRVTATGGKTITKKFTLR